MLWMKIEMSYNTASYKIYDTITNEKYSLAVSYIYTQTNLSRLEKKDTAFS